MARNSNLFTRPAKALDGPDAGRPRKDGYNDMYATGVNRRVADLRYGGQFGYSPDFTTWVNAHPYVSRNLIPILIEAPLAMKALPNADHWIAALRSLIETKPLSIQGLNATLRVQTTETPFGGSGQQFEVFTNVTEEKPNIQFTWAETVGISIYRFWSAYIRYFMMDPNTKFATINTIPGSRLNDLMADQYSFTTLFIEPDEIHGSVNQAWLVTNMFPKGTGDNTAKRDKTNDLERRDVNIEFTGIAQYGAGVDDFAQTILSEIDIIGADPHGREAFMQEISGYVRDLRGQGYESSAEDINPINRIRNPKANG